jgi:hypothetical protein
MNLNPQHPATSSRKKVQTPLLPFSSDDLTKTKDIEPAENIGDQQAESRRREFRWSKAARDLVRANMNAVGAEVSALVTRLVEESDNPRWACRRFVRNMGIRYKRPQRVWTATEQHRLLKLIDLHPVNEIARLIHRSPSSIWHMLQRLGANAQMGKDSFTKYTLAVALHVRPETVESWITRGWLTAREVETRRGKRVVIEAEDFCEFCRKHTKDVVGNRLTKERLDFVYHFAFPPSHAELLPVRDSKKERIAYEAQLNEDGPAAFGLSHDEDGSDDMGRIA